MNDNAASRPWRNKTLSTRTRTIHCALFPFSFGCFLSSSFDNEEIAASCFSPPPFFFFFLIFIPYVPTSEKVVIVPVRQEMLCMPKADVRSALAPLAIHNLFSHLPRPAALRLARHFFQVSLSQDPRPCYNLFRLRAFSFVPCGFAPSSVPSRTPCHFFDEPDLLLLRHCLRVCLFCFAC